MTAPEATAPAPRPGSLPGQRLHPLSPLVTAAFGLVRAWPIVIIALARGALGLLVVLAMILLVRQALVWLRTTYQVDDDGLVVRSGILWRTVQVVPPQRVQQVEVRRQLRHQAMGLAVVRVGLAGAGGTGEVELDALSVDEAERIGALLEQWRRGATSATTTALEPGSPLPPPPPDAVPVGPVRQLLALDLGQLVLGGLTSRSLWLAPLAAVAAVVQFVAESGLGAESADTVATNLAETSPAVLIVGVMVLALAVASVSSVVTHHGLVLSRSGDELALRRGLLEQRAVTIPRRRVQVVVLSDNIVRRRLGLAALDARTADLGGGGEDASRSSTSIPIGPRDELVGLVDQFLPAIDHPALERHPAGAVRRAVVRRSIRLVPAGAVLGLFVAGADGVAIGAAIGLVLGVSTGWAFGRRLRSGWSAATIVTERGVFAWRRSVVPVTRVQSVSLSQNPFQRRLGLATVRLDVAGVTTGVQLLDLGVDEAVELVAALGLRRVVTGVVAGANGRAGS